MVPNVSRASFRAGETFWKKSFHTSTGYVVWLSNEHFNSVARFSGASWSALGKEKKKKKRDLSELTDICIRVEIS